MFSNQNISSTEKQSPNIYNLQPHQQVKVCICGKVVFNKPITLPCGHKYHFKCARDFIFSQQEDTEENKCILCQISNQNSIQVSDSCEIYEDKNIMNQNNDSNELDKGVHQFTIPSKSNFNTSFQANAMKFSQEKSFKYTTPNTSKYPKQSRYSSYCDSSTYKKSSPNDFMISPVQGVYKSPQERVPFTDITCQINKTQSNNTNFQSINKQLSQRNYTNGQGFEDDYNIQIQTYNQKQQQNQDIQPFSCYSNEKNNIFHKQNTMNFIEILSEKIINRSQELQENSFSSQSHSKKSLKNEFTGIKLNNSDILKNNSFSNMSVKSNSISSDNSFFQTAGINGQNFSCTLFKQKKMNQLRQLINSSQLESNSYNSSMVSFGSDKENVRTITTKRTRNNILQVSFFEGLSFLCSQSLFTQIPEFIPDQNKKDLIKQSSLNNINQPNQNSMINNSVLLLPFCVELQNLYNSVDNNTFRNTQDILIFVIHDGMNSDQRYQLIKCFFDQIDQNDSIGVAWMDSKTKQVYKNQSDYFFGKEMGEIISKEFMRLQGHKETSFRLIDDNLKDKRKMPVQSDLNQKSLSKTFFQFIEEQYSLISNKMMIQHLIIIQPEQQNDIIEESSVQFDNVLISQIKLRPNLYQITKSEDINTEFSKLISDTLNKSRSTNIKSIKLSFEINPFLNNFIDFNLVNAHQLKARVQKITTRCLSEKSKSCENLISEDEDEQLLSTNQKDNDENIQIYNEDKPFPLFKKFVEISISFLRDQKIELLFEASFQKNIDPTYITARLFNCSLNYTFLFVDSSLQSSLSSSSLFGSINSEFHKNHSELNVDIKQNFPQCQEINQQLSNLYYLISWKNDAYHLCYNRRVMFSFWQHEIQNKIPQQNIQKIIFNKYKQIFEAISKKKDTSDFEEYNNFNSYYSNI